MTEHDATIMLSVRRLWIIRLASAVGFVSPWLALECVRRLSRFVLVETRTENGKLFSRCRLSELMDIGEYA